MDIETRKQIESEFIKHFKEMLKKYPNVRAREMREIADCCANVCEIDQMFKNVLGIK